MSESMLDHLFAAVDGLIASVAAFDQGMALAIKGDPGAARAAQLRFANAMAGARLHLRAARDVAGGSYVPPRDDEPWRTPGYRGDDRQARDDYARDAIAKGSPVIPDG